MIPLRKTLALAAFAALATAAHSQTTVYTNAGTTTNGFTGAGLTLGNRTDNGETWIGTPGTNYGFDPGTATLSLSGLAPHSLVSIAFDLYIVGTMDGNGQNGGGPDTWSLTQTGSTTTTLINTNFANYTSGNTQSFGGPNGSGGYLTGGAYTPRTGQSAANHLGFGTADFGDATYSLAFTFAGTSTSQVFNFISGQTQGSGDEGWGLDNIRVTIVPVASTPEPASFAALGVGALALLRRRRKA